jgi:hypothetical protein
MTEPRRLEHRSSDFVFNAQSGWKRLLLRLFEVAFTLSFFCLFFVAYYLVRA